MKRFAPPIGFILTFFSAITAQGATKKVYYSISEGMSYSILGVKAVQEVSLEDGYEFIIVADPSSTPSFLNEIEAITGQKPVSISIVPDVIIDSGLLNHFPTTVKAIDGKIETLGGFKTPERVENFLSPSELTSDRAPDLKGRASPEPKELPVVDRSSEYAVDSAIPFPRKPKYFIRPFASSAWLPFSIGFGNFLWKPATESSLEQFVRLPHIVDPVPTPDERFITIPVNYLPPPLNSLNFYSIDQVTGQSTLVYADRKMAGAYQSLAVLSETTTEVIYRAVTEATLLKGLLRIQDYRYKKGNPVLKGLPSFSRIPMKNKKLCPSENLSLPMLSKDGKKIAAVDSKTRVMQIFDLDEAGNCTWSQSTGIISGKVDFSWDGKRIAFHRSTPNPKSVAKVVGRPKLGNQLDLFEYNLESKDLSQLTHCGSEASCYYPNYLKDGSLRFLIQGKSPESYSLGTLKKK